MTATADRLPDRDALRDRVAVVAGATRGAGRGIAAALGEAGATVVCTGRTTETQRSEYDRAETIEETAALVTELGGIGIAIAADHLDPEQVRAIDTHLVTSHHLLPLLIAEPGGLLVEVTDGTTEYNASNYRISVYYDLAKVAVNRLAFSQGHELEPYGATAVALTPGFLRSEMMLDGFCVSEERWRDALDASRTARDEPVAPPDFALSESPRYVGRAVVALASDPERARWNQQSVTSGQLAREYGFTDVDGSQPTVWRYITTMDEPGADVRLDEYR
jgi:NAD(P)-dependent dehydrogenase (short-subunit alcohol dehydrogenase family)